MAFFSAFLAVVIGVSGAVRLTWYTLDIKAIASECDGKESSPSRGCGRDA
jgi:hypothetical protein